MKHGSPILFVYPFLNNGRTGKWGYKHMNFDSPHPSELTEYLPDQEIPTLQTANSQLTTLDQKPRIKAFQAIRALDPMEPIEWIVENLIASGTVNLLVGEPGVKKTWSMLDLALSISCGDVWIGHKTKRSCVLYIDEESNEQFLRSRTKKVLKGHGIDYPTPFWLIPLPQLNLRIPESCILLKEQIVEKEAKVVIIDAFADIIPGADENSVKDIQPVFSNLRKIADETKVAFIIIHHTNKSGNYRGSSAIKGAVDLLINIDAVKDRYVKFQSEKARNSEPFSFIAEVIFEEEEVFLNSTLINLSEKQPSPNMKKVIEYLGKNGPRSVSDITSQDCFPNKRSIRTLLYSEGTKEGLIRRTDKGSKTTTATFDLTEKGRCFSSNLSKRPRDE